LKHYHKNPRQITKKEFADLRDSLRKFGDLSGIVHNLNTDEIISGNQRIEVFDLSKLQIDITERLPEPDEQGTVATGWVIWEGKRYTYRAVMWDEKQSEEANVRANKAGGSWNFDILANEFSIPDLLEWGFKEWELGIQNPIDFEKEWQGMPEFEQNDLSPMKSIKINFACLADIDAFSELIGQKITDKTRSIWYPKAKQQDDGNEVYKDES
jgi:hypothetical protein